MEGLQGMPDIEAASGSTVAAWKKLQINTSSQLGRLHAAAGREEQAKKLDVDVQASKQGRAGQGRAGQGRAGQGRAASRVCVCNHAAVKQQVGTAQPPSIQPLILPLPACTAALQEKVSYLRSQAEMELQAAQQRLGQLQQQADAAKQAFALHLAAATE
jgi:hypothetical protein